MSPARANASSAAGRGVLCTSPAEASEEANAAAVAAAAVSDLASRDIRCSLTVGGENASSAGCGSQGWRQVPEPGNGAGDPDAVVPGGHGERTQPIAGGED